MRKYLLHILCLFILFPAELFAQQENDSIDWLADDFVTVSLVVCDPSNVLYSTLGHAALRLQCPAYDVDYIFSYESEDVRNKIWTFLRGDLKMGMYAFPKYLFLEIYSASGRGVREYTLNLSPEQKLILWKVLDRHVAQGNGVPYDYFHRGCAKGIIQVIHETIGKEAIHYAPWPETFKKQTQRERVRDFISDAPWEEFVMYFLIGSEADKEYSCEQKLIIPTDLVEIWQRATFDSGRPVLDSEPRVLLEATRHNEGTWCTPLLVSLVLLLLAFVPWKGVDYALLALYTLIGAGMTYLIVFSSLPCTDWNWLIIPFNILPAIFWHWRKYWALPYAAILFIWCLVMSGEFFWGHVLVDWSHIVLALSFCVVVFKQYLYSRK